MGQFQADVELIAQMDGGAAGGHVSCTDSTGRVWAGSGSARALVLAIEERNRLTARNVALERVADAARAWRAAAAGRT